MEWFWLILALLLGITAGWLFVGRSRRREGVQGAPATGTSAVTAPPTAGPDPSAVEQPATAVTAPSPEAAVTSEQPVRTEPAVETEQAVETEPAGQTETPRTETSQIETSQIEQASGADSLVEAAPPASAEPGAVTETAEPTVTTSAAPLTVTEPAEPATAAAATPVTLTEPAEPVTPDASETFDSTQPAEPAPAASDTTAVAAAAGGAADGTADDLRRIEGIGPKMAAALQAAGITSFRQLAEASEEELREALRAAGVRMTKSLPTWPQQAKILAGDPAAGAIFAASTTD